MNNKLCLAFLGPDKEKRGPLFQGTSCYPMSPTVRRVVRGRSVYEKKDTTKNEKHPTGKIYLEQTDQMACILRLLGTPKKDELDFITMSSAKSYIKAFGKIESLLEKKFHYVRPELMDILKEMLIFSPKCRISPEKLIK